MIRRGSLTARYRLAKLKVAGSNPGHSDRISTTKKNSKKYKEEKESYVCSLIQGNVKEKLNVKITRSPPLRGLPHSYTWFWHAKPQHSLLYIMMK